MAYSVCNVALRRVGFAWKSGSRSLNFPGARPRERLSSSRQTNFVARRMGGRYSKQRSGEWSTNRRYCPSLTHRWRCCLGLCVTLWDLRRKVHGQSSAPFWCGTIPSPGSQLLSGYICLSHWDIVYNLDSWNALEVGVNVITLLQLSTRRFNNHWNKYILLQLQIRCSPTANNNPPPTCRWYSICFAELLLLSRVSV